MRPTYLIEAKWADGSRRVTLAQIVAEVSPLTSATFIGIGQLRKIVQVGSHLIWCPGREILRHLLNLLSNRRIQCSEVAAVGRT